MLILDSIIKWVYNSNHLWQYPFKSYPFCPSKRQAQIKHLNANPSLLTDQCQWVWCKYWKAIWHQSWNYGSKLGVISVFYRIPLVPQHSKPQIERKKMSQPTRPNPNRIPPSPVVRLPLNRNQSVIHSAKPSQSVYVASKIGITYTFHNQPTNQPPIQQTNFQSGFHSRFRFRNRLNLRAPPSSTSSWTN